jgi:hypothetical protein
LMAKADGRGAGKAAPEGGNAGGGAGREGGAAPEEEEDGPDRAGPPVGG